MTLKYTLTKTVTLTVHMNQALEVYYLNLTHVIIDGITFQTDYVSVKLLKKIVLHRG